MDRRTFLKGLVATAAGVLVPGAVLAEPERRVWALDQTMAQPKGSLYAAIDPGYLDGVAWLETGFTEMDFQQYNRIPVSMTWRADAGYEHVEPFVLQSNGKYTCNIPPGYWHPESYRILVQPSEPSAFTVTLPWGDNYSS
jgi:hypothetical protein